MRDHRHLLAGKQLADGVVVIRVRVRDEHAEQWLPERLEAGAEGAAVGQQQRRVDRDHPVDTLDQVRVDEQTDLAGSIRVHGWSHASRLGTTWLTGNMNPV